MHKIKMSIILWIIIISVFLIIIGVAAYFIYRYSRSSSSSSTPSQSPSDNGTSPPSNQTPNQAIGTTGQGETIQCLFYNPHLGNSLTLQKFIPVSGIWTSSSLQSSGCMLNTCPFAWMDITGIATGYGNNYTNSSQVEQLAFGCCINGATMYNLASPTNIKSLSTSSSASLLENLLTEGYDSYQGFNSGCFAGCSFTLDAINQLIENNSIIKSAIWPDVSYNFGQLRQNTTTLFENTSSILGPPVANYAGQYTFIGGNTSSYAPSSTIGCLTNEMNCYLYGNIINQMNQVTSFISLPQVSIGSVVSVLSPKTPIVDMTKVPLGFGSNTYSVPTVGVIPPLQGCSAIDTSSTCTLPKLNLPLGATCGGLSEPSLSFIQSERTGILTQNGLISTQPSKESVQTMIQHIDKMIPIEGPLAYPPSICNKTEKCRIESHSVRP